MAYVSTYTVSITFERVGTYANGWATGTQTHTQKIHASDREVAIARAALKLDVGSEWVVSSVGVRDTGSGYYDYE